MTIQDAHGRQVDLLQGASLIWRGHISIDDATPVHVELDLGTALDFTGHEACAKVTADVLRRAVLRSVLEGRYMKVVG
jgi:hypothetical protein